MDKNISSRKAHKTWGMKMILLMCAGHTIIFIFEKKISWKLKKY